MNSKVYNPLAFFGLGPPEKWVKLISCDFCGQTNGRALSNNTQRWLPVNSNHAHKGKGSGGGGGQQLISIPLAINMAENILANKCQSRAKLEQSQWRDEARRAPALGLEFELEWGEARDRDRERDWGGQLEWEVSCSSSIFASQRAL